MLESRFNRTFARIAPTLSALAVVTLTGMAVGDDRVEVPEDAAEPSLEYFPPPTEVELQYAAALEKPITVTFDETPIIEALETLSQLTDAPIKLDHFLHSTLLESDHTCTQNGEFSDVPLSAVLARITLDPEVFEVLAKPVWYPAADGIILTLREYEVYGSMNSVTRIYPVGDLCGSQEEADQLIDLLKSSTGMYWKGTAGNGGSGLYVNGVLYTPDYDNDIYEMMAHAGSISYVAGVDGLVVKTGVSTHAEILELLRMLRQAKHAMAQEPEPIPTAAAQQRGNPSSEGAAEPVFTLTVPFSR